MKDPKKLDLSIGELYEYKDHIYEIIESLGCEQCAFNTLSLESCFHAPECLPRNRKDGKSAVFRFTESKN